MATASNAQLRQIAKKAEREVKSLAGQSIVIMTKDVVKGAGERALMAEANIQYDFIDATGKLFRSRPLGRVNEELGRMMRQAVIDEFNGIREGKSEGRRTTGPYRIGTGRRIGGAALLGALSDAQTVGVSGVDGIIPYVPSRLTAAAAFWRRLNFGTTDEEGYEIKHKDKPPNRERYAYKGTKSFISGSLKIHKEKSSYKPMMSGAFYDQKNVRQPFENRRPSSNDLFYPNKKGTEDSFPYRGNVAWLFLNVAYGVFALNAPDMYYDLYMSEIDKARRSASDKGKPFVFNKNIIIKGI
jgi:hypothetical protein